MIKNLKHFSHHLFIICSLIGGLIFRRIDAKSSHSYKDGLSQSVKPLYNIAAIGAPGTGPLIEGIVGSTQKGCRHRFYCHSIHPKPGFLGPQTVAEPISLRDQPGVFPAPVVGPATVTFSFYCQQKNHSFTPIVVRPDGTILYGRPMSELNSPQTLAISSPAQTGIYSLFILGHQSGNSEMLARVEASISTKPDQEKTFNLKSFDPKEENSEFFSAELIYTP